MRKVEKLEKRLKALEKRLGDTSVLDGVWIPGFNGYLPYNSRIDMNRLEAKVDLLLDHLGLELCKIEEHYLETGQKAPCFSEGLNGLTLDIPA